MKMDLRTAAGAVLLTLCGAGNAADVTAGKAVADERCVQCHEADDWDGEDAASLESLIRDIVAGKVKHKEKIELSPAAITNIAAYWAQSSR